MFVLLRMSSSSEVSHAFIGQRLSRCTCLAPEEFKKSKSGPWPKKVVHHCFNVISSDTYFVWHCCRFLLFCYQTRCIHELHVLDHKPIDNDLCCIHLKRP